MKKHTIIFSLISIVCIGEQATLAQSPEVPKVPQDPQPLVQPPKPGNIVPPVPAGPTGILTLDDVLLVTGANYPRLLAADADRQAASARRRQRRGPFDITASASGDYYRYNTSTSRGREYAYTANTVTAEMLMRSGVKFIAGREVNSGNVKSPLSSTGTLGTFFAGVKVPLLRGLGMNAQNVAERQAVLGIPVADRNYDTVRLSTLLSASKSYWNWVAYGQKIAVAAELLRLAELRAAQIRRENEVGAQPDIAVVEADQEVQRRRGALVQAQRDLQNAAFGLAEYLWNDNGTPLGTPTPDAVPSTIPLPMPLTTEEITAARERAISTRPEIRVLGIQREITQLDLDLAQNDTKPNLDITLQPGQDLGQHGIGDTMKAGITFSVPLNRWEATGRRDVARAQIEKLNQDQQLLRRRIGLEVDDAASAVNMSAERYQATLLEVELAARLEEGERTRFRAGDSTLFLVNQRERATAEARARLIDVLAAYQQATATFRAVSAQL